MFGRLTWGDFDTSNRAAIEEIADIFDRMVKTQKGFVSVTYFLDLENGRVGDVTVWETMEDLEAWANKDIPELREKAAPLAKGNLTRQVFEVYAPPAG